MKNQTQLIANKTARAYGTNRATEIRLRDGETQQLCAVRGQSLGARVVEFDGYHAESRTGIRASMAALKRYWSTYHYVPTRCAVVVPDRDAIYSCDSH